MIRLVFGILALLFTLETAVVGAPRAWTQQSTKKTVIAEFLKAEAGVVTLELANGREARVPVAALIPEDQAIIELLVKASESGGTEAWANWRGPNRNGVSNDSGLINEIPEGGPKKNWVFGEAGAGYSGFTVAAGRLYSMGSRDKQIFAFALDVNTGEELWSTVIGEDLDPEVESEEHMESYNTSWGTGPRSTPTFNAGLIFALAPLGELVAMNAETGEIRWQKNLVADFEGDVPSWGFSESPTVDGEMLLVTPGSDLEGGKIVALNKRTGKTMWHAHEVSQGRHDSVQYASITPALIQEQKQYVQLFKNSLLSLAEDGTLLWRSDWPKGITAVIPTPLIDGNRVYVTSGYGAGARLIEIQPDNSIRTLWENTVMKNHHGGVVKLDDTIYGYSEGAGFIAQDYRTGKLLWNIKSEAVQKGSVVAADGHLFLLDEGTGTVTMIEPSREDFISQGAFTLAPQSENRSPNGKIWTHPIITGGRLYLRDQEFIVCYDLRN